MDTKNNVESLLFKKKDHRIKKGARIRDTLPGIIKKYGYMDHAHIPVETESKRQTIPTYRVHKSSQESLEDCKRRQYQ